jgi:spermidine/putrescine-binding protein
VTLPFALHYQGNLEDPAGFAELFSDIQVGSFYTSTPDMETLLQQGDVTLAIFSDGRCKAMREDGLPLEWAPFNLTIEGNDYEYVAAITGLSIAEGANIELSHAFIDYVIDDQTILPFLTARPFTPTVAPIHDALMSNDDVAPLIHSDPDTLYVGDYSRLEPVREDFVNEWNRTFGN